MISSKDLYCFLCEFLEVEDKEIDAKSSCNGFLVLKRYFSDEEIKRSLDAYCEQRGVEIRSSVNTTVMNYFIDNHNVVAGLSVTQGRCISTFCFVPYPL